MQPLKTLSLIGFMLALFPFTTPFTATVANAQTTNTQTVIEDPNNVLAEVDQFVSPPLPFAQEFVCGAVATFDHPVESCTFGCGGTFGSCWNDCTDGTRVATHTVSQCSSSQISIFSDDAENTDYSVAEYANLNGDLVRKFMANLSIYISASGKIVLTAATPVDFVLVPGQAGSPSYSALNVTGTFILDGYQDGLDVMLRF